MKEELAKKDAERIVQLYVKYNSTYKVAKELNISQSTVWRKLRLGQWEKKGETIR
jgi:DNA invertase Pin-like site-specific DNA recombinase